MKPGRKQALPPSSQDVSMSPPVRFPPTPSVPASISLSVRLFCYSKYRHSGLYFPGTYLLAILIASDGLNVLPHLQYLPLPLPLKRLLPFLPHIVSQTSPTNPLKKNLEDCRNYLSMTQNNMAIPHPSSSFCSHSLYIPPVSVPNPATFLQSMFSFSPDIHSPPLPSQYTLFPLASASSESPLPFLSC